MNEILIRRAFSALPLAVLFVSTAWGQDAARVAMPPLPEALGLPKPGPVTDAPYAPQPILPGGVVVPLYPLGSPFLTADKVREAEQYSMSQKVKGLIASHYCPARSRTESTGCRG